MCPKPTLSIATFLFVVLAPVGQAQDWSYTQNFDGIPISDLSSSQRAGFTWVTEEGSGSAVRVISTDGSNHALSCSASPGIAAGTPGKAAISQDFGRVPYAGDTVVAGGRYFIDAKPVNGSLYLLDVEVRDSPISTKPGYRFKVSEAGQLHINFKAIPQRTEYNTGVVVPMGRWFHFETRTLLSLGASGAIEVRIDGNLVYTLRGNNLPEIGHVSYCEVGATANSGTVVRTVLVDDLFMRVLDASVPALQAPQVSAVTAAPSPVIGTSTSLSASASDDGGEAALTYAWAASGPAAVAFSANGSNAAKNTTATFSAAGSYVFTVTVTDGHGLSATRTANLTVVATATTITVAPTATSVVAGSTVAFTATVKDQFGAGLAATPVWAVTGGGSISAAGVFTAGAAAGGPYTVSATLGARTGTTQVTVTAAPSVSLPAGWSSADIGAVALAGSASVSGGTWTVTGSGADIWGTQDEFHCVGRTATGDVRITARVAGLTNTDGLAKAGVMIRADATAGSRHAFTCVTPSYGVAFMRRLASNGVSGYTAGPKVAAPYWLRVERVGNLLIGSSSPNGSVWTEIRRETVTMSATVYVGLAVTAHRDGAACTATFTNVEVVAAPSAAN